MKDSFKTYFERGLALFLTVAACILFFFLVYRFRSLQGEISAVVAIVSPFIYGAVIAYLLMPLKKLLIRRLYRLFGVESCTDGHGAKRRRLASTIAIFLCIVAAVLIIYGLFALIVPQLIDSIAALITAAPTYYQTIIGWVDDFAADNEPLMDFLQNSSVDIAAELESLATNQIFPNLKSLMSGVSSGILSALVGVKDLIIGLIIAAYMLDKSDTFLRQSRMILLALFPYKRGLPEGEEQAADWIMRQARILNDYMGGFINGKLLDSLIIGLICLAFTTLVRMPYAVLISVIVGVTNIIPFFGPFIGAIPSALLVLIVDPLQCVVFVIFIIILQQFDGNILGPHILGNATNLDSFWVLFAILFFGGMYGVVGMVIGVPVFGFIYQLIRETVNKRLARQRDILALSPHTSDLVKDLCVPSGSSYGTSGETDDYPAQANGAYPSFEPSGYTPALFDSGKTEAPEDDDSGTSDNASSDDISDSDRAK